MPKKSIESLRVFIYLDAEGIESLYAQTVNRLETELVRGQEKEKSGKLGARIGVGRLLGALLGLTEVGADTELSMTGKRIEEAKMRLTIEHKLLALIKYLTDLSNNEYFEDLARASNFCSRTGKSVFVCVNQNFNLPQFYLYKDGVAEVNSAKVVDFEIGPLRSDPYNYSDNYFKRKHYRFFMSASLSKFTRSRDLMSRTGHDAMFFGMHRGKNIPLGVFGYLKHLGGVKK